MLSSISHFSSLWVNFSQLPRDIEGKLVPDISSMVHCNTKGLRGSYPLELKWENSFLHFNKLFPLDPTTCNAVKSHSLYALP